MRDSMEHNATFATTHWTAVLQAGNPCSSDAVRALEELCRTYWYPLYAYARSKGHEVEDAKDLTQEFFARLLEKNYLGVADRRKGQFRWFLLTAFKHFLANEYDRAHAAKRGGGSAPIPLDTALAENLYQTELRTEASPDQVYDRSWALTLLEKVRNQLRDEHACQGKGRRFSVLEAYLPGETASQSYAEAGAELGISGGAIKVEVHRMKQRFSELLRSEIGRTVAHETEIDGEVRYLVEVLALG